MHLLWYISEIHANVVKSLMCILNAKSLNLDDYVLLVLKVPAHAHSFYEIR